MSDLPDDQWVKRLDDAGFATATRLLAAVAQPPPDVVVGVAPGGGPLALALGSLLSVPASVVTASRLARGSVTSFDPVAIDATEVRQVPLAPGAQVWVVGHVYRTGAALKAVARQLARHVRPLLVVTVTLCRELGSPGTPDLWVWDVADRVVFPWEAAPPAPEPLPAPTTVQRALP